MCRVSAAHLPGVNIYVPDGDEMKEHGLPEVMSSQFKKGDKKMTHQIAVSCGAYEAAVLTTGQHAS